MADLALDDIRIYIYIYIYIYAKKFTYIYKEHLHRPDLYRQLIPMGHSQTQIL